MFLRSTIRVLLFLCFISASSGAEWHVAPNGVDRTGDGSKGNPWRSLQKACDRLKPGDSLIVHAGVYAQRLAINVSGTKGNPITIVGEPGAILTGKGVRRDHNMIEIADQSHLRLAEQRTAFLTGP